MGSREHFEFLVQQGIIDRAGRVFVAKLFGEPVNHEATDAAPADTEPAKEGP
jgi:hypothetical protein